MTLRLLDLYCCAGGAGMGYSRAGFKVVGVDIHPQPRYPFEFIQGDALAYVKKHGREYDAIHASPPCQAHVQLSRKHRGKGTKADEHVDLIGPTRRALREVGVPYVIENVMGARSKMVKPALLNGAMFDLGVHRPRFFETSWPYSPPVKVRGRRGAVAVYGKLDGRRLWTRTDGTELRAPKRLSEAQRAMGIDWMTWPELTEAIPPPFTEHVGEQLRMFVKGH